MTNQRYEGTISEEDYQRLREQYLPSEIERQRRFIEKHSGASDISELMEYLNQKVELTVSPEQQAVLKAQAKRYDRRLKNILQMLGNQR